MLPLEVQTSTFLLNEFKITTQHKWEWATHIADLSGREYFSVTVSVSLQTLQNLCQLLSMDPNEWTYTIPVSIIYMIIEAPLSVNETA